MTRDAGVCLHLARMFTAVLVMYCSFLKAETLTLEVHEAQDICHLPSCQPADLPSGPDDICSQLPWSPNTTQTGRCCLQNSTVTGIDLRRCSLKNLDFLQSNITKNVKILFLAENPIHSCTVEQFQGMKELNILTLPVNCLCPGVRGSWDSSQHTGNETICKNQVDWCGPERNYTCPQNSFCEMDGPGYVTCKCEEGFHGYKCLRKGEFPYVVYFTSIGAATLVLSLMFGILTKASCSS